MKSKKILFLVPYPLQESPSQRFRFEQYFGLLTKNGYSYTVQTFLQAENWKIFFTKTNVIYQLAIVLDGFWRRLLILFRAKSYDYVFIHREAAPVGPPIIEWILAKILNCKIIYDFDDAIWLTDRKAESPLLKIAKWRSKVASICAWSYKVSCGNEYLCEFARQFNRSVIYNPTTVDTDHLHNPDLYTKAVAPVTIGWTGSHSTLKYLNDIQQVVKAILKLHPNAKFLVIADQKPSISVPYDFIPWQAGSEIKDLLNITIGIMPLPDDEWSKGKCGFKALQYMALQIPAVVSPVGVNDQIVDHGVNGFLARTQEEWIRYLDHLINHQQERENMGRLARQKVIDQYSCKSNASTFLSLFN